MIPLDIKNFINIMSLVIFGGILVSAVFTIFAYALAINRRKTNPRPTIDEIEEKRMPLANPSESETPSDK
jgi:predicted membrane protein